MRLSALLLALLSGLNLSYALRKPSDSVLLSKISSLTLRAGQKTSARRGSAIPQLQCMGGNARGLYDVDVMRCTNAGSDYDDENVQWTCKASLPPEFKLGSTDVSCEGYDSPEDPYVLKGSCGVSYRLMLTEEGERKYGHRKDEDDRSGPSSTGEKLIFWAFFTFVAGMIVYGVWDSCVRGNNRRPPHAGRGYGGGWGGNNDDNNDDAPPPYTPYGKSSSGRNYGTQGGQAWRPGFWTGTGAGAAAGAAAGYMAGNRASSSRSASNRSNSGNWGGSTGSSSPVPSSSRYESTGFGSSSRR
ncbi:DUF1183-domain-containing protein [Aureobasidium subglaciale]|nr:DUF1183-domain-containing protein [Aureobasidium subglaciale]KAI5276774.1 DUF1183-domain-containing protein [Aureobasidium subglaciale]